MKVTELNFFDAATKLIELLNPKYSMRFETRPPFSQWQHIFSRRHGITSNGGNTRVIVGPSNTTTDCHKFKSLQMADANWALDSVRFALSAVEHIKESQDGYAFCCLPISFMDVTDVLLYEFLHSLFWRNPLEPCETQASLSTCSINMVSMFHRKFNREC